MSIPSFEESSPRPSKAVRPRRSTKKVFDLPAACATLPYLNRILSDIVREHARWAHLSLAMARIQERRDVDWDVKRRGFALIDEMEAVVREQETLSDELRKLGAILLDPIHGVAGFPTIVNGSLAYLVYRLEDNALRTWRYRDQPRLRPIPESWFYTVAEPTVESEGLLI